MRLRNFTIYTEAATITGLSDYTSTLLNDRKSGGFLMGSGVPSDDINVYVSDAYESGANLIVIEEFSDTQQTSATADIVIIFENKH